MYFYLNKSLKIFSLQTDLSSKFYNGYYGARTGIGWCYVWYTF